MSAQTTRVLLVRHGATTSTADDRFAGSSNVPLSDEGRRQVQLLGERLAKDKIDAVYCSDMQRAIDTANAVASHHGLTPTVVPALRELDHGHWEGLPHKEVEQKYAAEYAAWSADPLTYAPPGGSTGLAVLERAALALRRIVSDHPGQTVLIASHKATIRLLIAYHLGMDLRRYRDRLDQDPACLNVLAFDSPTEARLLVLNDTGHGDEFARHLGARHVIVDRARELVPVSGTAIRERPMEHWRFLPPALRPHFVKRVAVIGPESTGKTTLCRMLADRFATVWASEYARGYLDNKKAPFDPTDLAPIARGQLASEDALARQANRVLFSDTDLSMTVLYSRLYHGTSPAWLDALAESSRYDLHLVTDCDVPWVADPQRDLPHRREEIRDTCVAWLERTGRKYVLIRGSWEDRLTQAYNAVERLLRADPPDVDQRQTPQAL